jgi:hypothetical protein
MQVKDKTGQDIFLRDQVSYTVPEGMGDLVEKTGYVICFLSEEMVEIQPDNKGEPIILPAGELKVTQSLVQDIASLSTYVEFQLLLKGVEERYEEAVIHTRKPRATREKSSAPKEKSAGNTEIDVEF